MTLKCCCCCCFVAIKDLLYTLLHIIVATSARTVEAQRRVHFKVLDRVSRVLIKTHWVTDSLNNNRELLRQLIWAGHGFGICMGMGIGICIGIRGPFPKPVRQPGGIHEIVCCVGWITNKLFNTAQKCWAIGQWDSKNREDCRSTTQIQRFRDSAIQRSQMRDSRVQRGTYIQSVEDQNQQRSRGGNWSRRLICLAAKL